MNTSLKCLVISLLLFCGIVYGQQQLSIFVAVDGGSDATGDGTMGNPFQSISAAQNYLRNNVTQSSYSDIFVEIRAGIYFLSSPLAFTAQDSGTATTRITYRAYNGEDVRLIGGASIGGWASVTDNAILNRLRDSAKSNVIVASLGSLDPGVLMRRGFGASSGYAAMELFFKTEPMTLARYPNQDFLKISGYQNVSGVVTISFDSKTSNVDNWNLESDPWAFGFFYYDWADDSIPIKQITGLGGSNVSFVPNSGTSYGFAVNQRFYLQNFLSELDSPGEYYIDRNNSKIYFWPPSSDYTQNDFIVSTTTNVLTLTNVQYFTLQGLTIEASRKDGIVGNGLQNVTFSGLTVRNLGTHAMNLAGPANILVERCIVSGPGNSGIRLSGGTRANLTRSNHVARNNVVKNFSRTAKTYQPAFNVAGVGITIENNEMFNGPHTALLWSGNYHLLQFNVVHDVCTETGDVGAFYSGRDWTLRGNVIKHNLFYNIIGPGNLGASGVYFDDQYSSGSIYGNIFYNVYRGVLLGGGRDSEIFNNIFIGSQYAIHVDARGYKVCGPTNNATLMNNLNAVPYQSDLWRTAFPTLYTILENDPQAPNGNRIGTNIFVNNTRNNYLCGAFNYTGHVELLESCFNLTASDFTNVPGLDFHLQSDAIASKCGSSFASAFSDIPLDNIGVAPVPTSPSDPNSPSTNNGNPNNTPKAISQANNSVSISFMLLIAFVLFYIVA